MNWSWFLFSFEGRISRTQYWLNFILPTFVLWLVLVWLFPFRLDALERRDWPFVLYSLALLWPGVATQVKRWHDRGKSGWWCLINFIPIVGGLWAFIETGFLGRGEGANRYGPDPRQRGQLQS